MQYPPGHAISMADERKRSYGSQCSCGWISKRYALETTAAQAAGHHIQKVTKLARAAGWR
jgi:hypothetical protein